MFRFMVCLFFFSDGVHNCWDHSDESYCTFDDSLDRYIHDYGFLMFSAVLFVILLIILGLWFGVHKKEWP